MSSCARASATGRGTALGRESGKATSSPPSFHTSASALPLGAPLRPDGDDCACVAHELRRNGASTGVDFHDLHALRFARTKRVEQTLFSVDSGDAISFHVYLILVAALL